MSLIEQWNSLPMGKRTQLAGQFGIKWCGTNDEQLDFDLRTKLPVGTLKVEKPKKVIKEVKEEVIIKEPVAEVVKPIKKKKK